MKRTITLGLVLAGLVLVASSLAAAGGNKAMSPVGAWAWEFVPDQDSPGDPNTGLTQYNFGGTTTGAAWTDPWTNPAGEWQKVGRNRYRTTFYVMIPPDGFLRNIEEFWMVNKDEMEGRQEGWWVPGTDPLGEAVVPLWWGTQYYRRIQVEPKQIP